MTQQEDPIILSQLAGSLVGNEIVKLNGEIRKLMEKGERIFNFTVGDFDPSIFPIPKALEEAVVNAYRDHFTNYPIAEGDASLRKAISSYIQQRQGLTYGMDEILVACGGRPLIYALYRAVVDKGDKVIYPVPSWNNNHYTNLIGATNCTVEVTEATGYHPTAAMLAPHLKGASLLALSSPLNPTGTVIPAKQLQEIAEMVVEENRKRGKGEKKLYVMYDQIYWQLTYGDAVHHDPVRLCPEVRPYTIFVDGISKCFAATGLRVGWSLGPAEVIAKMKAFLTHVGGWSPLPEQKATAAFLGQTEAVDAFLKTFKADIAYRLTHIYEGITALKKEGYPVDAIAPQSALYLSIKLDLAGKTTATGQRIDTPSDATDFILKKAGLAVVPFPIFGSSADSYWYRLSVGTCRKEDITEMLSKLKTALQEIS